MVVYYNLLLSWQRCWTQVILPKMLTSKSLAVLNPHPLKKKVHILSYNFKMHRMDSCQGLNWAKTNLSCHDFHLSCFNFPTGHVRRMRASHHLVREVSGTKKPHLSFFEGFRTLSPSAMSAVSERLLIRNTKGFSDISIIRFLIHTLSHTQQGTAIYPLVWRASQ